MGVCISSFLIGIIVGIFLFLLVLFIWGHIALSDTHGIGKQNSSEIELVLIKIGFGFFNFISVFSPPLREYINTIMGGKILIGGNIPMGGNISIGSPTPSVPEPTPSIPEPTPSIPEPTPPSVPSADNVASFLGGYY